MNRRPARGGHAGTRSFHHVLIAAFAAAAAASLAFPAAAAHMTVGPAMLTPVQVIASPPAPPTGPPSTVTGEMFDDDTDGFIDRVRLLFDLPVATNTGPGSFTLTSAPSGRTIQAVQVIGNVVTLTLGGGSTGVANADTAATDFRLTATVAAVAGGPTATLGPIAPADRARPVLLGFSSTNAGLLGRIDVGDTFFLDVSEPLANLPAANGPALRVEEPGGQADTLTLTGVVPTFSTGSLDYLTSPGNSNAIAQLPTARTTQNGGRRLVFTLGSPCVNVTGSGGSNAPCNRLVAASGTAALTVGLEPTLADAAGNLVVPTPVTATTRLF